VQGFRDSATHIRKRTNLRDYRFFEPAGYSCWKSHNEWFRVQIFKSFLGGYRLPEKCKGLENEAITIEEF
jgi:hypothetical protein